MSVVPVTEANTASVVTFDVLYIIGGIALGIILITAVVSHRIRRQLTWYMVIASWVWNSASNLLLIGHQRKPLRLLSPDLCLAQAILIDSTPVFCAFCAAAFAAEIHTSVLFALTFRSALIPKIYTALMIAVPLLAFGTTVAITASNGLAHREVIEKYPSDFFCWNAVPNDWRKYLIGGGVAVGILCAIILEVMVVLNIRNKWEAITETMSMHSRRPAISRGSIARMIVFSAGIVIALGLTFIQYLTTPTLNEYTALGLVQATLPFFAALIFGSQKDVTEVWLTTAKSYLGRRKPASNNLDIPLEAMHRGVGRVGDANPSSTSIAPFIATGTT